MVSPDISKPVYERLRSSKKKAAQTKIRITQKLWEDGTMWRGIPVTEYRIFEIVIHILLGGRERVMRRYGGLPDVQAVIGASIYNPDQFKATMMNVVFNEYQFLHLSEHDALMYAYNTHYREQYHAQTVPISLNVPIMTTFPEDIEGY